MRLSQFSAFQSRAAWISLLVAFSLFGVIKPARSAWQTDWEISGPVLDFGFEQGVITSSADGGFTITAEGDQDVRVLRVEGAGAQRWLFALPISKNGDTSFNLELTDGSVAVSSGWITLLSPYGIPVWQSHVAASMAVEHGEQIAVVGCQVIAAPAVKRPAVALLDRVTGAILWQSVLVSQFTGCSSPRIAQDDNGQLYVSGSVSSGTALIKIGTDGQVIWSATNTSGGELYVRGNSAYLVALWNGYPSTLTSLRIADGAVNWQKTCISAKKQYFVGNDPLCQSTTTSLQRLSAVSGSPVWTYAKGADMLIGTTDDDVYLVKEGRWQRLNGMTGQSMWDVSDVNFHVYNDAFVASPAAGVIAILSGDGHGNVRIDRYWTATGAPVGGAVVAAVPKGVTRATVIHDSSDIFLHSNYDGHTHLRRLSASAGALVWDKSWTDIDTRYGISQLVLDANSVAVSFSADYGFGVIRNIERATGTQRWWTSFVATSPFTGTEAQVAFAPDGDLFYSADTSNSSFAEARSAGRLDGNTGEERWARLLTPLTYVSMWSLPLRLLNGDAILGSDPSQGGAPLQRLSGADGSTQWADISNPLVSSGSGILVGNGAVFAIDFAGTNNGSVSKLDAATGALLWQRRYADPAIEKFNMFNYALLPDGDVLISGYAQVTTNPRVTEARVLRFHGDGSGVVYDWKGTDGASLPGGTIVAMNLDPQGNVWLHWNRSNGDLRAIFLTRFDAVAGKPLGSQALPLVSANLLRDETDWNPMKSAPQNDELLLEGLAYRSGRASTHRDQLLGIRALAHGDLSVEVSPIPGSGVGSNVPFRVVTKYAGDARIVGARTLIRLPWAGRATDLHCLGSGLISCSMIDTFGEVEVNFTADPGAQIVVTGNIVAQIYPSGAGAIVRAITAAYPTLVESQTGNNFGASGGERSLFANGFQ